MKTLKQILYILFFAIAIFLAVFTASLLLFSESDIENFFRYNSLGLQVTGLLIFVSSFVKKIPSLSGVTTYVPSTDLPELTPANPMPWKEDIERKIRNIQTHLEELESHVEAINKATSYQSKQIKRMVNNFYAYWRFEIIGFILLVIGMAMHTLSPELAGWSPELNDFIEGFPPFQL